MSCPEVPDSSSRARNSWSTAGSANGHHQSAGARGPTALPISAAVQRHSTDFRTGKRAEWLSHQDQMRPREELPERPTRVPRTTLNSPSSRRTQQDSRFPRQKRSQMPKKCRFSDPRRPGEHGHAQIRSQCMKELRQQLPHAATQIERTARIECLKWMAMESKRGLVHAMPQFRGPSEGIGEYRRSQQAHSPVHIIVLSEPVSLEQPVSPDRSDISGSSRRQEFFPFGEFQTDECGRTTVPCDNLATVMRLSLICRLVLSPETFCWQYTRGQYAARRITARNVRRRNLRCRIRTHFVPTHGTWARARCHD